MLSRLLALILILVSGFLLFWRLDGTSIWRDEGTTAVWARYLAESDNWLPYVYDFEAKQLMVQAPDGHDVNSKLLPAMQSYLQFYVSALSFELFGVTEWASRAPYALFGAFALWLLYRLGAVLIGGGPFALIAPALAATSIFFLHAARQGRYYVLVICATAWLLLEFAHYFRRPERAGRTLFWIKLAAAGFFLYASNYVSFVGTWLAIGIFVLWRTDRRFIVRFVVLSAIMAAPILLEFFLLHSEFVETWPPAPAQPLWDVYQTSLIRRGTDLWRVLPIALLVPAAIIVCWRVEKGALALKTFLTLAVLAALSPFVFDADALLEMPWDEYLAFALFCLAIPAGLIWWARRRQPASPAVQVALLAGLMLMVGPLLTILAGQGAAITRHYYQILPGGILLSAMAVAAFARHTNRLAGTALFSAALLWPSLDLGFGGTEHVVPRQYLGDDSYIGPVLHFFNTRVEPGDEVAFVRNVKGMPVYFYFPETRWVGLLNAEAPHNQRFLGRIPADQFDVGAHPDWYVLWDTRDEVAKNLDSSYEQVWEYSYGTFQSWWDRHDPPRIRTYRIYRRTTPE